MKYIITILLFTFISISVQAQNKIVINPATGTRNTISHNADSWFPDSVLMLPSDSTYPRINMTNYLKAKRLAAMQVDTLHNIVYIFNPHDTAWFQLNSSVLQYLTFGATLGGGSFNGSAPLGPVNADTINYIATKSDLINGVIIINPNDSTRWAVDSILKGNFAGLEGHSYLIWNHVTSGTYTGHEQQILTVTGSINNYQTANVGDFLTVAKDPKSTAIYTLTDTGWALTARFVRIGGDLVSGKSEDVGAKNNKILNLIQDGNTLIQLNNGKIYEPEFIGSDSSLVYDTHDANGKRVQGHFTPDSSIRLLFDSTIATAGTTLTYSFSKASLTNPILFAPISDLDTAYYDGANLIYHFATAPNGNIRFLAYGSGFAALPPNQTALNYITQETPSGTVNSSNTSFALAFTPVLNTESIFVNGILQKRTTDYTISGTAITFTTAPFTGYSLLANYYK